MGTFVSLAVCCSGFVTNIWMFCSAQLVFLFLSESVVLAISAVMRTSPPEEKLSSINVDGDAAPEPMEEKAGRTLLP